MLPGQATGLAASRAVHDLPGILAEPTDPGGWDNAEGHDHGEDAQRQDGSNEHLLTRRHDGRDGTIPVMPLGSAPIGSDTSETCWLCDRERGELCHVHERLEQADDDVLPDVVWTATPMEAD